MSEGEKKKTLEWRNKLARRPRMVFSASDPRHAEIRCTRRPEVIE